MPQTNQDPASVSLSGVSFDPRTYGVGFVRTFFRDDAFKPTMILLYAALVLSLWKYIPPRPIPADATDRPRAVEAYQSVRAAVKTEPVATIKTTDDFLAVMRGERKIFAVGIIFGLIPAFFIRGVLREKLADYGVRWGNFFTLRSIFLFTPLMIGIGFLAGCTEEFALVYPFHSGLIGHGKAFAIHSVCYVTCFYVTWEFFFRGVMLRGLIPTCGVTNAILIQALVAAMLHFGHPLVEVLGSCGGSIFWGILALRTRSILSGTVQHATLGIALDWFLLA